MWREMVNSARQCGQAYERASGCSFMTRRTSDRQMGHARTNRKHKDGAISMQAGQF